MPASAKNIRDQNLASIESARQVADATRQAAETTQETIRTAIDAASRTLQSSTEQFTRSLGFSGRQGEELALQSTRNLEALSECGAVLMRGFQEISREWMSLAQHRLQKNLEGVQALASCQTVQDVVVAQTELVRDNFQQIVENSRQIAETSVKVADEAAQTLTGPKESARPRFHRAA